MSSDNDMATPISSPRCEYIFRNKYGQKGEGAQCSEHAYADGKCLLHVGLPAGSEFKDLVVKKAERTVEKAPSAEPKGQGSLPSKSLKCYSTSMIWRGGSPALSALHSAPFLQSFLPFSQRGL